MSYHCFMSGFHGVLLCTSASCRQLLIINNRTQLVLVCSSAPWVDRLDMMEDHKRTVTHCVLSVFQHTQETSYFPCSSPVLEICKEISDCTGLLKQMREVTASDAYLFW